MRITIPVGSSTSAGLGVASLLALIGVGLALFAVNMALSSLTLVRSGGSALAEVRSARREEYRDSKGHTRYRTRVELQYQAGDQLITVSTIGAHSVGEQLQVLYDRRDPHTMSINSFGELYGASIFMMLFSVLWLALGVFIAKSTIARRRLVAHLRRYGEQITATITSINSHSGSRGARAYSLVARAEFGPFAGNSFTSERLIRAPHQRLIGSQVPVLVDPSDASRYLVDTSALNLR